MNRIPVSLTRDVSNFLMRFTKILPPGGQPAVPLGHAEAVDEARKRAAVGKFFCRMPSPFSVTGSTRSSRCSRCTRAAPGHISARSGGEPDQGAPPFEEVSYLVYPDFDTDPQPALLRSIKLSLRTRELDCYDYAKSTNPPILHRKETFLPPDHPHLTRFARLTRQEENHGLLDETATIGTRDGWNRRLEERGFSIKGHRLVKLEPKSGGASLEDAAVEKNDSAQTSSSS